MSRNRAKSIYSRVKEIPATRPMPVMIHGDKMAQMLHGLCDRVTNHGLKRVKFSIDTLKLSAAHAGSYSLSANQIGNTNAIFVIHKHLIDNVWIVPEAQAALDAAQIDEDGLPVLDQAFLNHEDFESYMNPKVLKETTELVYDWEFCSSFPNIRCMVRRPTGLLVSYIDGQGDEIEKDLSNFAARVFMHELDHINGRTMTHWRISEGNIDILDSHKVKYPNLMTTVDFYKSRFDEAKSQFESELF